MKGRYKLMIAIFGAGLFWLMISAWTLNRDAFWGVLIGLVFIWQFIALIAYCVDYKDEKEEMLGLICFPRWFRNISIAYLIHRPLLFIGRMADKYLSD